MDGEKIIDVVPCLHQHAEDAVSLTAFLGSHTLGHLLLHHTHHLHDLFLEFQHLEENLAANVVGEIADDGHVLLAVLTEVGAKEVAFNEPIAEHGKMLLQVGDGLLVDLDDMELVQDIPHQELRQHARAGAHLDDTLHIG